MTEEEQEGERVEVTYRLFSNVIKNVFGAKVEDETFRFHSVAARHEPDQLLNQISSPNIRLRRLSKTIACVQQ